MEDKALPAEGVDLSAKMRDYLVEIYRLSAHASSSQPYVSTSALADLLDVTAPAVNRMMARLKDLHLLHHEPYQGVRLTEQGKREALIRLRYHRIAEAFLVNVMGFGWHEIYEEAQHISSALSETLAQRMLAMAHEPQFCPHGEPIPQPDGTIATLQDTPLTESPLNITLTVTRVLTREPDRLSYLGALGLMPGAAVQVIHIAPFSGPLQLKLKDEYRIIGHNLAEAIKAQVR
ncbi:MAG: metal-dependent transcriptional regulator [Armatimonadetes bacterium]|nr:metal-dependent transcriptional regulator [Anaerolineae bacterium]